MAWIGAGVAALGIAAALVLTAFNKNLVFFFTPSQVAANEAPLGRTFRIGGMVVPGSVKREGVEVRFVYPKGPAESAGLLYGAAVAATSLPSGEADGS